MCHKFVSSIDATEVTSLMDDLGLLRDLKSNVIEFVAPFENSVQRATRSAKAAGGGADRQKAEAIRRHEKARIKATNKGGDDKGLDERILRRRRRKAADGRAAGGGGAVQGERKGPGRDEEGRAHDVTDDVIGGVNIGAEGRAARRRRRGTCRAPPTCRG